ncbi:hypothetical protein D9M70_608920 [compost metagenome]
MLIDICGPEKVNGTEIAIRFSQALGRAIKFRSMPPEEFAKAISFGGNEGAIIGYYQSIFENPAIMTTNVDHEAALKAFPIRPMTFEEWAHHHGALFTKS